MLFRSVSANTKGEANEPRRITAVEECWMKDGEMSGGRRRGQDPAPTLPTDMKGEVA